MAAQLDIPEHDQLIWSDKALNRDEFYASLYLLQQQQRQQEPDDKSKQGYADREQGHKNSKDRFLDRLALLFARTKTIHTPQNVTATALAEEGCSWNVYIAKNNGPYSTEGGSQGVGSKLDDNTFAKQLEEFLALDIGESEATLPTNVYWTGMLTFWEDRIIYYMANARKAWQTIKNAKEDITTYLEGATQGFNKFQFDQDWIKLTNCINNTGLESQLVNPDLNKLDAITWLRFYNFWQEDCRQRYPRPPNYDVVGRKNPQQSLANDFRKCIHYVEMLGMPKSIWDAMIKFRELRATGTVDTVHIKLVKKIDLPETEAKLDKDAIAKVINRWKDNDNVDIGKSLEILGNPSSEASIVSSFKNIQSHIVRHVTSHMNRQFEAWPLLNQTDQGHTGRRGLDLAHVRQMIDELKPPVTKCRNMESHYKTVSTKTFHGSFGTVYEARENLGEDDLTQAGPSFAMKRIEIDSTSKLKTIIREIATLHKLNGHLNILALKEALYCSLDPYAVYLATSPWAPVSLHIFILNLRDNRSVPKWHSPESIHPWPSIVTQCVEGLEYLHRNDIKHKDLKPRNILLLEESNHAGTHRVRPIIADFGLSKEFTPGGVTDNLGTTEFKAPEQLAGDEESTLSSDIWSLGCCFIFISVFLDSGRHGLNQFCKDFLESSQPGFAQNIERIQHFLSEMRNSPDSISANVFLNGLREVLKNMIKTKPSSRLSAKQGLEECEELSAHVKALELQLPKIFVRIRTSGKYQSIAKQDLPTGRVLYELSTTSWLWKPLSLFRDYNIVLVKWYSDGNRVVLDEDNVSDFLRSAKDWRSSLRFYSEISWQYGVLKHGRLVECIIEPGGLKNTSTSEERFWREIAYTAGAPC
ncbi:kinase-like domain-containing protein [Hypoxylon sp. NC1633]|nr:kinase-like domain-containing protein [Hypoxylon sp. NC1633]